MSMFRPVLAALLLACWFAPAIACQTPYPPSMIKAFTQNCSKDAHFAQACDCMIQRAQQEIPLDEFIEAGNQPGGLNSDARFVKASKECASAHPVTSTPAPPAH
jgi:hypothetical protein